MNKKILLGICVFGLFLRLGYIFFVGADPVFPDEYRFLEEAESILVGTGLQANGHYGHDMPLTALLVAGVLFISSGSAFAVKIFFGFLSTITIFLVGRFAFVLSKDNQSAILAAGICAVYPFFIFYSSLILSETLFLFLFVLFLCLLFDEDSSGVRQGISAGLMHLTKPIFFYFFPVIWLWQYFFQKIPVRKILTIALVTGLVVSPWVIRNFLVFDELVINTASSGHILWEGNNPWNNTGGVSGTFQNPDAWLNVVPDGLTELEEDQWKENQAINFVKRNPVVFVENGIRKFLRLWSLWPNSAEHQSWIFKAISILSFGPMLLFSLIGVWALKENRREIALMVGLVGYITLLHVVTLGSIRYRLPLESIMIVIASMTLKNFYKRYNQNK
ncbi:ArnT family glycosyltransferase [Arenicellales bacterium nBUS_48]